MCMKRINKLLFLLIIFLVNISFVYANSDKNLVNIYLFHSDTCPHCKEEIKFLDELEEEYNNIRIYKYEIGNTENLKLLEEVSNLYDTPVMGVPFTVIGDKYLDRKSVV